MGTQWYIKEEVPHLNELSFYGPFPESELEGRLNDAFADLMASGKANLDALQMDDEKAKTLYINPPSFWDEQLAEIARFDDVPETPHPKVGEPCPYPQHKMCYWQGSTMFHNTERWK